MRLVRNILLALALGGVALLTAKAQPYCDVRRFSILDGLAANTISDLQQAPDKVMWFGTWNGLSYYDGYTFITFRDGHDGDDELTTNRIRFVRPNFNNDVWFSTSDRYAYLFDTHRSKFVNIKSSLRKMMGRDFQVKSIFPLPTKATWLVPTDKSLIIRTDDGSPDDFEQKAQVFRAGKGFYRGGEVYHVKNDAAGREWVLTSKGPLCYGRRINSRTPFYWMVGVGRRVFLASRDGRLAEYTGSPDLRQMALPKGVTRINDVKSYDSSRLFLATNIGIVSVNMQSGGMHLINIQNPGQPLPEAKKIFVDDKKNLFFFTEGPGISVISTKTHQVRWLQAEAPLLERTTARKPFIMQDEHNTVWAIPRGGTFAYYDNATEQFVPYPLYVDGPGKGCLPQIDKYAISDQGILWVTADHDLVQINFKLHQYTLFPPDEGSSDVRALAYDHNGRLWAGYYNGVVQVVDTRLHTTRYLAPDGQLQSQQTAFSEDGIYALHEDRQHRLWIGTKGDGIYILPAMGGKLTHLKNIPGDKGSLSCDKVVDIQSDHRGRVWVASYGGGINLAVEQAGRIGFVNPRNGLNYPKQGFDNVRRIFFTAQGVALVCTNDGLLTFSEKVDNPGKMRYFTTRHIDGDTTSLMASDVVYAHTRADGCTFVASLGGSIEFVESRNLLQDHLKVKYLPQFNPEEGIYQSVTEDRNGCLWIVRESSLDKFDPATGRLDVFGPNDFDGNIEFSEARSLVDPTTGAITIGTNQGPLTFLPGRLTKTNYQPRIIFTYLQYQGEHTTVPILNTDQLEIPSGKRNLTIYFSALDYSRNYQMRYAYKIDGKNDKWIELGALHCISFNNIPHGHYRILVRSTNTHGVWSDKVAALNVYVHPTFWESVPGRLLIIVVLGGIVWYLLSFYKLRQRHKMESDMSRVKSKFYSDMGHQLRTPLTLIEGPVSEVLETENLSPKGRVHMSMVQRNARNMLRLVNKMLKFDNKQNFYSTEEDQVNADGIEVDDKNAAAQLRQLAPEPAAADADNKDEKDEKDNKDNKDDKDSRITILVVEDNADLREFLYGILAADYNVLLAENGQVGLELAQRDMPDFILSDVTMPVMDGLTMVHLIKQDKNISHIPIIILSAKASAEDRARGFQEGIDAYITKPFSATYLKGRIQTIIGNRQALQQEYLEQIGASPAPSDPDTMMPDHPMAQEEIDDFAKSVTDDATMRQIVDCIKREMHSPNMKIDDIARLVGMSRSVLYSKIKNAVGTTPIELVHHLRLKQAQDLLRNSDRPVSDIAYTVGFSDPKYFSKVFRKEVGMSPTDYRNEQAQGGEK